MKESRGASRNIRILAAIAFLLAVGLQVGDLPTNSTSSLGDGVFSRVPLPTLGPTVAVADTGDGGGGGGGSYPCTGLQGFPSSGYRTSNALCWCSSTQTLIWISSCEAYWFGSCRMEFCFG
jgi:hypothetical protein